MTICYILYSFGTFFSGFGMMYQENSGNPGAVCHLHYFFLRRQKTYDRGLTKEFSELIVK
jgi:hypothetical protein